MFDQAVADDQFDDQTEESRERRAWRFAVRAFPWFVMALSLLAGSATIIKAARLMIENHPKAVTEVDSQGYYLSAKTISEGKWPRWPDDIGRFRGHVWVDAVTGETAAKYPIGAPLLIAIGYKLNGFTGAMWTNVVLTIIGLIAFYFLAWDLFSHALAAICTYIWAFSPMMLRYAVYPLGHASEMCIISLAAMFTVRTARTGSLWFGIGAGCFVAFMPMVRPTLILLWPAFLIGFLSLGGWARMKAWRTLLDPDAPRWRVAGRFAWRYRDILAMGLAFAAVAIFNGEYNQTTFGRPWWTGYRLSGEDVAFDFTNMRALISTMLDKRGFMLEDGFWLLCLLGIWLRTGGPGAAWMLAIWAVPIVLIHAGYYFRNDNTSYFRLLLPAVMAFVLCIGLPFRRWGMRTPLASLVLLIIFFTWVWYQPPRVLALEGAVPDRQLRDDESAAVVQAFFKTKAPPSRLAPHFDPKQVTDLYCSESAMWDASVYPNVNAYALDAWTDAHFLGPANPSCRYNAMGGILFHKARHERIHQLYQSMGRSGLRAAFVEHVRARLSEGHLVLFQATADHPLAQQLTRTGTLKLEPEGDPSLSLWRVSRN